jgi:hypothetical protein
VLVKGACMNVITSPSSKILCGIFEILRVLEQRVRALCTECQVVEPHERPVFCEQARGELERGFDATEVRGGALVGTACPASGEHGEDFVFEARKWMRSAEATGLVEVPIKFVDEV